MASPGDKLGAGVLDTLRREGEARVVVALEPVSTVSEETDEEWLKAELASMKSAVLSSIDPSDFVLTHSYDMLPGFAGTVLSEEGLGALEAHPSVIRIDLDLEGGGSLDSSVPLINADDRHERGNLGDGVTVAVLDSGYDSDHDDLEDDLVGEECFLTITGGNQCPDGSSRQSGGGAAEDDQGHGTNVSGVVTSAGNVGSPGVAPGTGIFAVKVSNNQGPSGRFVTVDLINALNFIADNPDLGIDAINMSLGTDALFTGDCDGASAITMTLAAAVDRLRSQGILIFAASGNNSSATSMAAPACIRNVISVGATNDSDVIASFSNISATTDILAPGVSITTSALGGGTSAVNGTSFAAPHAAGCAALLIELGTSAPDTIEDLLESSPTVVSDLPRIDCGIFVDVDFLVDLSGSFADDLPIFQAQAPLIVEELKEEFSSIRFGLGRYEDYPIPPFGDASSGDVAFARVMDLTFDSDVFLSEVDGLFTRFGGDAPQSQLPALFQAATGAGQDLSGVGFPGASIPAGQQANFRDGAAKIFLLWTDASFHLPGDPGTIPYPGPSFSETIDAVLALDPPQVIGISSGGGGLNDLQTLATATGAVAPEGGVDCDGDGLVDIAAGEPLVCPIASSGLGIGEAVIAAVMAGVETGTSVDADEDGIPDDQDECPASNLDPTVIVDGIDTGVSNILTTSLGCTVADLIAQAAADAAQRTEFIRNVSLLTRALLIDSLITRADAGAIRVATAQASFPPSL